MPNTDVYGFLEQNRIPYKRIEHAAVFTVEESSKLGIGCLAENTKNLFLADEKDQRFYLLTIQHHKRADLKKFASAVGEKRLHFAPADHLLRLLGITPGSVSALGLMNDAGHSVKFYLDEDLLKGHKIYMHPNINTATLEVGIADFKRLMELLGVKVNPYAV